MEWASNGRCILLRNGKCFRVLVSSFLTIFSEYCFKSSSVYVVTVAISLRVLDIY